MGAAGNKKLKAEKYYRLKWKWQETCAGRPGRDKARDREVS